MTVAETIKFHENIGKTWMLKGYYHGGDTKHLKSKGVVYVLIINIRELNTGDEFRDHTHIEVSEAIYERYFKNAKIKAPVEFTAKTYYYNKDFTRWQPYIRRAIGLKDMNEIKIEQDEKEIN